MRFLIGIIFLFLVACQATTKISSVSDVNDNDETVLFTVNGEPVLVEEFTYVYNKNNINNDSAYTRQDIDEYLELYKKFKLKIAEAKILGLDTTASFQSEFDTYKGQLKKPYLTESRVTEGLIEEAYERYKEEVNTSHILITLDPSPSPADTLAAYNQAIELKEKIENGEEFEKVAVQFSQDPTAKENKGLLGYFTSFQMVYPFESGAYNTPKGGVSDPVRTRFGYHLIKVNDRRPNSGTVGVSHIMIRIKPDKSDSLAARNKIFEIYEQAQGGVSWKELVSQFSEDVSSKNNGGKLRPFTVGQMPFPFQEMAFTLNEVDQISDPVMTKFGWHILKLESREPLKGFDELRENIESRVSRDTRAQLSKKLLISKLKSDNNFALNSVVKSQLLSKGDTLFESGMNNAEFRNEQLFQIENEQYKVSDFLQFAKDQKRNNNQTIKGQLESMYSEFERQSILDYEERHLEEKYIDYRMLVKEYREGILLFQLMEDKVWNKAVEDTVGLKKYYDDHQVKYQWGERAKTTIYNASSEEIIAEISQLINKGDTAKLTNSVLEERFNADSQLNLQITGGLFEKGKNKTLNLINWEKGTYTIEHEGRYNLIIVHDILPPGAKKLNEIKGLVISDYQDQLEQEWLVELAGKHPVEVNTVGIKSVYAQLEK